MKSTIEDFQGMRSARHCDCPIHESIRQRINIEMMFHPLTKEQLEKARRN